MNIRLDLAGDAAAGISIPFIVLLLGWIVATLGRVAIAKRQSEVWNRLVDKLDSASVGELLSHDGGLALQSLLSGPDRPHARIIVTAQASAVLLSLGAVLFAYAQLSPQLGFGGRFASALVLALGVGLGAAAGIGYWLSARWDLLAPRNDTGGRPIA